MYDRLTSLYTFLVQFGFVTKTNRETLGTMNRNG